MKAFYLFGFVLFLSLAGFPQGSPVISQQDRIRLQEAFHLADEVDDKIWKGWKNTPFAVLLVTTEYEFLIRHPEPSADFVLVGKDELLDSNVYFRKRTQPVHFLATFPLVGATPTVVIGQAENTSVKTSTRWVLTLLHEHFHQWQMTQPDYYSEVEKLNLSGGDQTGMWMLNYPFPYEAPDVQKEFHQLAGLLKVAIMQKSNAAYYFQRRKNLPSLLKERDYKYLSFQLWQEGIARYTEYRVAEWARDNHKPLPEFQALSDYKTYGETYRLLLEEAIEKPLMEFDLAKNKRECFYPFGAAEGILLDRLNPDWRDLYMKEKFFLESYISKKGDSDEREND